ncbi:MAG: recombinase family protein [Rhodospirillaceae bacterium]|nr:recombinase family protein [Rhodospirillaceae bacterium]
MSRSPATPRRRCAIYTRKSSEEGLDQEFNSLDAQREACAAYIRSQVHEGWTALPRAYDDGGFSGGSMDRPGLQRLLADIQAKRIDIVVVYKVDRLTRSLADFARIIEILDGTGASFVSVTQNFNTTSSMGRLTLNVLLSFAQFEREVTGERIRDKFAASKRKGIWMGGPLPLGYRVEDRKLLIVPEEAERVRQIYRRYLEIGSINDLARDLEERGIRGKARALRSGLGSSPTILARGALYHLLRNRLYLGEITHKGTPYPGQHEAIIPKDLWHRVSAKLDAQRSGTPDGQRNRSAAPLAGRLFDSRGHRMTPGHTMKGKHRYRYYVSLAHLRGKNGEAGEVSRIGAETIERMVLTALREQHGDASAEAKDLLASVERVTLMRQRLIIRFSSADNPDSSSARDVTVPIHVRRVGHLSQIIPADGAGLPAGSRQDRALIQALLRAHRWRGQLESGETVTVEAIAQAENVTERYVRKLLPLGFLAPDLAEAVLEGRQPSLLTLAAIASTEFPIDWQKQRQLFSQFST